MTSSSNSFRPTRCKSPTRVGGKASASGQVSMKAKTPLATESSGKRQGIWVDTFRPSKDSQGITSSRLKRSTTERLKGHSYSFHSSSNAVKTKEEQWEINKTYLREKFKQELQGARLGITTSPPILPKGSRFKQKNQFRNEGGSTTSSQDSGSMLPKYSETKPPSLTRRELLSQPVSGSFNGSTTSEPSGFAPHSPRPSLEEVHQTGVRSTGVRSSGDYDCLRSSLGSVASLHGKPNQWRVSLLQRKNSTPGTLAEQVDDTLNRAQLYEEASRILRGLNSECASRNTNQVMISREEIFALNRFVSLCVEPEYTALSERVDRLPKEYGQDVREYLMREFDESIGAVPVCEDAAWDGGSACGEHLPAPVDRGAREDAPALHRSQTVALGEKEEPLEQEPSVAQTRATSPNQIPACGALTLSAANAERILSQRNGAWTAEDAGNSNAAGEYVQFPSFTLVPLLGNVLRNIDTWNVDMFKVNEIAPNGALAFVGYALFERHGFIDVFDLNTSTLDNFLNVVSSMYPDNPYHNSIHAADVTHCLSHFMVHGGLESYVPTPLQRLSALFAAIVHDVNHPGVNNNFLIQTHHELAVLYNDKSPLEMMHASTAFQILQRENCDITQTLTEQERLSFRPLVVNLVLATDNAEHSSLMKKAAMFTKQDDGARVVTSKPSNSLMMEIALHAADICAAARPWDIYLHWSNRVITEFRMQGDMERELGLKVIPLLDRHCPQPISRFQSGFVRAVVRPLYETLHSLPHIDISHCVQNINNNLATLENMSRQPSSEVLLVDTVDTAARPKDQLKKLSEQHSSQPSLKFASLATSPINARHTLEDVSLKFDVKGRERLPNDSRKMHH